MRRSMLGSSVLALAMVLGAGRVSAQGFMIGGGANLPMGDFKDAAKTGWAAMAGLHFPMGSKSLSIRVDGNYSQLSAKGTGATGHETLIAGLGGVQLGLGQSKTQLYLVGEVGYLHSSFSGCPDGVDCGSGAFAWAGGAGVTMGTIFLEGRYVSSSKDGATSSMILAEIGLNFGGKKK